MVARLGDPQRHAVGVDEAFGLVGHRLTKAQPDPGGEGIAGSGQLQPMPGDRGGSLNMPSCMYWKDLGRVRPNV
ncbi:hypothetical protein MSEN_27340 [Mycolicibacter senuensis]|uniref:Uncharacterized protein n=1 Tax=Mycolicibacter senuensis TaxID=386913 RepID=A0A7I9XM66_9MYCO|nr:hypothetical protein MSEN_27340 [Mycolicibacter senuensis]